MKEDVNYGECVFCECALEPVWFIEEEYKTAHGCLYKTGRKRMAIDYLVCPACLSRHPVDDTFDHPWRQETSKCKRKCM